MVWYGSGMVWFGMVLGSWDHGSLKWFGFCCMVWLCMVWYGSGMVWFGMVCCIVWFGLVWFVSSFKLTFYILITDGLTDGLTDRLTLVLVKSLSRLKIIL